MNKCAMCGRIVEGRYVCKSCEGKVKGNLNPGSNPCGNCPSRAINCHSTCEEYIEWGNNRKAVKDILYRKQRSETDAFMTTLGREKRK